jgi:WD40 repeat protein
MTRLSLAIETMSMSISRIRNLVALTLTLVSVPVPDRALAGEEPSSNVAANQYRLRSHSYGVYRVAFDSEGQSFASFDWHGTVILWDVDSKKPFRTARDLFISSTVALDPRTKRLLGFSTDSLVDLTPEQVRPGNRRTEPKREPGVARFMGSPYGALPEYYEGAAVAFSPGGELSAFGYLREGKSLVRTGVFGPPPPILIIKTREHGASMSVDNSVLSFVERNPLAAMEFLPDGKTLLIAGGRAGGGGYLLTIDTSGKSAALRRDPLRFDRPVTALTVTSREVAVGFEDDAGRSKSVKDNVAIIDVSQQEVRKKFFGCTGSVSALVWSARSNRLFVAGQDPNIHVFSGERWGEVGTLTGHDDSVTTICSSNDGKWLASGSTDKTVILWELKD